MCVRTDHTGRWTYWTSFFILPFILFQHEAISAFPSEQFYSHDLHCGKDEQSLPSTLKFWPNGRNKPIAFVHVVGQEETLAVATSDGSEQSKSNMEEVTQAVSCQTYPAVWILWRGILKATSWLTSTLYNWEIDYSDVSSHFGSSGHALIALPGWYMYNVHGKFHVINTFKNPVLLGSWGYWPTR